MVMCTAVLLAACQADGTAGLAKVDTDPFLDIALRPAANAVFPSFANARITASMTRDTIEFTVVGLPPLGGGSTYQIALVDTASARATNVISHVTRTVRTATTTKTDTSIGAQFAVTDTATSVTVRMVSALIPTFTHVVLRTAGEGSVPLTLTAARTGFLAFRYRAGASYAVQLGDFGAFALASADRLPFTARGDVVSAAFWGDWVRLELRNLTRPPAGFRYAAWLVDQRGGTAVRLGGLIAPTTAGTSLDDADLGSGPWYSATAVLEARVRCDLRALGVVPQHFTLLAIVLEPYGGWATPSRPGLSMVLSAPIPASVASRPGAARAPLEPAP